MEYLRSPYLLRPLLAFLVLLAVDKLFLLPEVRDCFLQPGGMVFYRQRLRQIDRLQKEISVANAPATAVVFGDSRSFAISNWMLYGDSAQEASSLQIYNFAGPQANPAYHHFLAEKIFQGHLRPGIVWIGLSPDALNRNGFVFGDPVLKFGVDGAFVRDFESQIPATDLEVYRDSRRFAFAGMNVSLRTVLRRIRGDLFAERSEAASAADLQAATILNQWRIPPEQRAAFVDAVFRRQTDSLRDYCYQSNREVVRLDAAHGAQFNWFGGANDAELRAESERLKELYLKRYLISQEQFFFLERMLERLQRARARVVLFWPPVNPHLREAYRQEESIAAAWRRIEQLASRFNAVAVDLNEPGQIRCNQYYDASHMSNSCFPEITARLIALTPP